MKKFNRLVLITVVSAFVGSSAAEAQQNKKPVQKKPAQKAAPTNSRGWKPGQQKAVPVARPAAPAVKAAPRQNRPVTSMSQKLLSEALTLARNGTYDQAAVKLFALSRRNDLADERMQIKYLLGVCLMELKFYQTAAFQFVDVIRNGNNKYTRQAIEKLSIAADELGDDTLLNYAVSKVQLDAFPDKYKDVIFYRLGEIKLKNGQFEEANQAFGRVNQSSRYYAQARFNKGRALLEAKQPNEALKAFQSLLGSRATASVTDTNKVAAELAIARTYYQAQQWDEAIEWYRKVPRDTEFWHQSIFEESWAYLRAAKFRSALSNFQSIHSAYYEDYYIPESLLLRSIVYLYICKYDEMEKVLDLFEKTYGAVRTNLGNYLTANKDPQIFFNEVERAYLYRQAVIKDTPNATPAQLRLPYNVSRYIMDQGDVKRAFNYLRALSDEKRRLDANPVVGRGGLAGYANKILSNRAKNTKISIGEMAKTHIVNIRAELRDLYEQAGFIRYEMINGKKESLKKKIAGKDISGEQIDDDMNREFYVQNGYEYWPFDGEFWLDEVGNYHYLGKQSCE